MRFSPRVKVKGGCYHAQVDPTTLSRVQERASAPVPTSTKSCVCRANFAIQRLCVRLFWLFTNLFTLPEDGRKEGRAIVRLLVPIFVLLLSGSAQAGTVTIATDPQATPRELYGAARLREALERTVPGANAAGTILVGVNSSSLFAGMAGLPDFAARTEAFHHSRVGDRWIVAGSDPSRVLYGCLELARRISAARELPRAKLAIVDDPSLAEYKKVRPALQAWVRGGGKLLIWDPLSRAIDDPLLEGITFWADPSYRPSQEFAYADMPHRLLEGLSGTLVQTASLIPGMRAASPSGTSWPIPLSRTGRKRSSPDPGKPSAPVGHLSWTPPAFRRFLHGSMAQGPWSLHSWVRGSYSPNLR